MKQIVKKLIPVFLMILSVFILKKTYMQKYIWNVTNSMPIGIYLLEEIKEVERDQIIYIAIPEKAKQILWERNYLPKEISFLVKQVKGIEGDIVTVCNNTLYINGIFKGKIKEKDNKGLPLNGLSGTIALKENEYFLMGKDDESYDSRYFGTIKKDNILKKATLVFSF
ncbi:MAG: conjugative transfer signal peptidase TraF [Cetobacterium sp.]